MNGGFVLAFIAAAAFGLTTPLVQRMGRGVGPFTTASLLYVGAALVAGAGGLVSRARGGPVREAPVHVGHMPRLLAMAVAGAWIAPAALAWGLQRTSGTSAGLALNLEAVFTAMIGRVVYREHIGRRVAMALAWMTVGGALLVVGRAHENSAQVGGLLAVTFATFAWGVDNALSNGVASLDPGHVVLVKGALGAVLSTAIAVVLGERLPPPVTALELLACGGTGYGLSLRLYLLAQRRLGAARTASLFAVAPFVAAGTAVALGQPFGGALTAVALVPLGIGLALHVTEKHAHRHRHVRITHDHRHRHDDAHHDHVHDPPFAGEHAHEHVHEPTVHDHDHMPDPHHEHEH